MGQKDKLNWSLSDLFKYAKDNQINDSMILDWLNSNYGVEKQFWYGQRTLREAVLMAMVNQEHGRL